MTEKRFNFSTSAKFYLTDLVKNHKDKDVLISQNNSGAVSRAKEKAWQKITEALNASTFAGKEWTAKQVKACFFNMRKTAKSDLSDLKSS